MASAKKSGRAKAKSTKAKSSKARSSKARSSKAKSSKAKSKARPAAKARALAATGVLHLRNRRQPLAGRLAPAQRAQVLALVEGEGYATIDDARADDEFALELVDVVDAAGKPRYQLYLWPFGSAVMYAHGTTDVVGGAVQHGFAREDGGDPDLVTQLHAAWHAEADKLGIHEGLEFNDPPLGAPEPRGRAG